ncbi:MAG: hypothetical protein VX902_04700, partial [Planctomycetota bacterium]|nr:hypothetical protein [Planctomycetota bacterium]
RPICNNLASTLSHVQAMRSLFRQEDSFSCIFFSIFLILVLQRVSMGSGLIENFNGPGTVTTVAPSPGLRVLEQRIGNIDTTGHSCETIVLQTDRTTLGRILFSIPESAIIDEFLATIRLRCDQPSVRLACQIKLPSVQGQDGQAVRIFLSGSPSTTSSRWQSLTVGNIPSVLRSQLPALRAQYGPQISLDGATISGLAVEIPLGIGRCNVSIDNVSVTGLITAAQPKKTATSPPSMLLQQNIQGIAKPNTTENAGLVRGVLEVDGRPFFPRAVEHRGEPFIKLAQLGFNCVQLYEPASTTLLAEAEQAGVWIICPPPTLPDVDLTEPEKLPTFSDKWNRVLLWDMGRSLSSEDIPNLAEQVRRLRICDRREGRPIIASADSGLREISRHIDMLVAHRAVLGTSLELANYLTWLQQRPRLARPGTPLLATLATEIDSRTASQAALLSGTGSNGLPVDEESLLGAAFTAIAAGSRGILFSSNRSLSGTDPETVTRAAAVQAVNLELETISAWGASGRFTADAETSDPEVRAMVIEASRSRIVLIWRSVQGGQIMARHYRGDIPRQEQPLNILIPGIPEAHRPWEITHSTLRPLQHRRVTGGVSMTLDNFHAAAVILISNDPAATAHIQELVRRNAPTAALLARAQAADAIARTSRLAAELPPKALGHFPVTEMIIEAQQEAQYAEAMIAQDPTNAVKKLERSRAIAGQLERLFWERGVTATGSMVASPLTTSPATLSDHWRMIDALQTTKVGGNLLEGGHMEEINTLSSTGWRHFVRPTDQVKGSVELSGQSPADGQRSLRIFATAIDSEEAPVVIETPPIWITTPPIYAAAGTLLEIVAQVRVPNPIEGSVDGLLVFDSYGGPALAERVNKTESWRRLVLYRIVPPAQESSDESSIEPPPPLTVTFALTGLGEAQIDSVSIKPLSRGNSGPSVTQITSGNPNFPKPDEILQKQQLQAVPVMTTQPNPTAPTSTWPGMSLEWPKMLPFTAPETTPPRGPSGSTIDPFKRARAVSSKQP